MADIKPLKIDPAGPKVPERFESGDTVGVVHGGTGLSSISQGNLLVGGAGNTFSTIGPGTAGQVPTSDGTTITMQDAPNSADLSLTNGNAGTLAPGCPVYLNGTANTVDKARANAIGTSVVAGLAKASVLTTATGSFRSAGRLSLTTGQWDAITGETGGLTAGARYFLDAAAAGELVQTPVDAAGNFLVQVGVAISTTDMLIQINQPIGL